MKLDSNNCSLSCAGSFDIVCFKIHVKCREFQKTSFNCKSSVLHLSLSLTSEIFGPWHVGDPATSEVAVAHAHQLLAFPRFWPVSRGFSSSHVLFACCDSFFYLYLFFVSISLRPHLPEWAGTPCHHVRKNVFWAAPSFVSGEAVQKKIHGTDVSRRTAEALGVSEQIFCQVRSESSSGSATKDTPWKEICGRKAIEFDGFVKGCVRWEVHAFFLRKEYPTMTAVLQACKGNIQDFPAVSHTTLWRLLKSMGFKYKKRSRRHCIHERADVVLKRHHYLGHGAAEAAWDSHPLSAMRRGWTNITPAPGHGRTPPTCELNPIELIRIWAPIKGKVAASNKTTSATLRRWADQRSNRTRVARKLAESLRSHSPRRGWLLEVRWARRRHNQGARDRLGRGERVGLHRRRWLRCEFRPRNLKKSNKILISVLIVVSLVSIFRECYLGWNDANKNFVTIFFAKIFAKGRLHYISKQTIVSAHWSGTVSNLRTNEKGAEEI